MVDDAEIKTDISAMELSSSPQEIVAILGISSSFDFAYINPFHFKSR